MKKPSAQEILNQFRIEKQAASKTRQSKMSHWLQNEELHNGVIQRTLLTKSNLHVPKVFEGVQDMASRLGELPTIEYDTKPEGDENAADLMKHLFLYDGRKSDLEHLWELSKIEAGLYGRPIYKLFPSPNGVAFQLIDTMSFLISPLSPTIDSALYCGQQFIYKTAAQLMEEAEEYGYDKKEVMKARKAVAETISSENPEVSQRNLRLAYLGFDNVNLAGAKVIELTEWYTHLVNEKGLPEKYLLTVANDQFLLRAIPITEAGFEDKFPFISRALFPRLVSFWVPSVADIYRDPNLAMDVIMNQNIDNNTYRNFGMLFVDSASGLKQSAVVPRPLGVVPINVGAKSVKDAVLPYNPPDISQSTALSSQIETLSDNAAGLGFVLPMGRAKMSVSQLNLEMSLIEQRLSTSKMNLIAMAKDMGQMYADLIKKNLTTPRAVKTFGMKDLTISGVTKANFKGVDFIAKATAKENVQQNKALWQKSIQALFAMFKDDQNIPNQRYLRELTAEEFGLTPTQIDKLMTRNEQPAPSSVPAPAGTPAPAVPGGKPAQIPTMPNNPQMGQVQEAAQIAARP
ncbi:hypothetical protein M1295_01430 [Patescibacteria group bacterium]|nr:hypothetical protein [Patescibacteria group bacterium]